MNKENVSEVKEEINRLVKKIEELESESNQTGSQYYWYPKYTGAVRRASMDLTRALAKLRKH